MSNNQNIQLKSAAWHPVAFAFFGSLRNQLFFGSALLCSAILLFAAWAINHQVVRQARAQLQTEVATLLPLYDAVLNERARRLATLSATMAGSPIIKAVFGDARAARDQNTLRQMFADVGQEFAAELDLTLICDGDGQVVHAERRGAGDIQLNQFEAARLVGQTQQPMQTFAMLKDGLFQLALTPVLLQAGRDDSRNTLGVFGNGFELDRAFALEIKRRIHADLIFLVGSRIYLSSLAPEVEKQATRLTSLTELGAAPAERPVEISLGDTSYLAFSRPMNDFAGEPIGQMIILRSLAGVGQFSRSISQRLFLLWALVVALAWLFSYLLAGRITRPLEALADGARALGQGNTDYPVPAQAQGEIGQLARAFEAMRQSLKQAQAKLLKQERQVTIGLMAPIIGDLRTPLETICATAETLNLDGDDLSAERRRSLLAFQQRAAQQMNDMLHELYEFAQGSYQLECRPLPLATLIGQLERQFQPEMKRAGIAFTAVVPAELVLKLDEVKLRRALEILFLYSIKTMPHGGVLTVKADSNRERVRIDITDSGPSVSAEQREQLFEPFSQNGGAGLGLAVARGLIEAHGGIIGLVESPEPGAHFFIHLPGERVCSEAGLSTAPALLAAG